MARILITPVIGTARTISGKVMTGGHHYVLVAKNDVEIRNALTQGWAVALDGVEVNDNVSATTLESMVRELALSRAKDENESYEDYRANLYRFAVEALNKEAATGGVAEDEVVAEEKVTAPKARTTKAKTPAGE